MFSRTAAESCGEMTGDRGLVTCNNASKLSLIPQDGARRFNMEKKLSVLSLCSKYKDKISLNVEEFAECMGVFVQGWFLPTIHLLYFPLSSSCLFCSFVNISIPPPKQHTGTFCSEDPWKWLRFLSILPRVHSCHHGVSHSTP